MKRHISSRSSPRRESLFLNIGFENRIIEMKVKMSETKMNQASWFKKVSLILILLGVDNNNQIARLNNIKF